MSNVLLGNRLVLFPHFWYCSCCLLKCSCVLVSPKRSHHPTAPKSYCHNMHRRLLLCRLVGSSRSPGVNPHYFSCIVRLLHLSDDVTVPNYWCSFITVVYWYPVARFVPSHEAIGRFLPVQWTATVAMSHLALRATSCVWYWRR